MRFRNLLVVLPLLLGSPAGLAKRELGGASRVAEEGRFALVIGNQDYNVGPLAQPEADARMMAAALKEAGFAVELKLNLDKDDLKRAIIDFGNRLERGGVGLFYYAGHGLQVDGENYLVPVDARIHGPEYISVDAVDARLVLKQFTEAGSRVNIMVLDACRNNPFKEGWVADGRSPPTPGLAQMSAPAGTLIAFSTGRDRTAKDDSGYTEALVSHMRQEGLTLGDVFRKTRQTVYQNTRQSQLPWEHNALMGDPFYFRPILDIEDSAAQPGTLSITVESGQGDVLVDGALAWSAANEFETKTVRIKPGLRRIRVGSEEQELMVRPGATLSVSFRGEDTGGASSSGGSYEMVRIRAGEFMMGSPRKERGRYDDETQHRVRLRRDFYLGKREVSQGLWREVMGSNPASGKDYEGVSLEGDDLPVVYVSWLDVARFANALSVQEGLERCYEISGDRVRWPKGLNCTGYRLPTEAEWEYAARAGTKERYAGTSRDADMCQYGNVSNPTAKSRFDWSWEVFPCEDGHTALAPVGSFEPNGWGLYDMSGNVWEWCWDWYGDYPTGTSTDPLGPNAGSLRVVRGGSWLSYPRDARVANRSGDTPSAAYRNLGLRLARSL